LDTYSVYPQVTVSLCSNGVINAANGEECDDGNLTDGDGCSSVCAEESGWTCTGEPSVCSEGCGNGVVNDSEECDDGNTSSGDGCSATCDTESGFLCSGTPSTCQTSCGDGVVVGQEECEPPGTERCANNCLFRTGGGTGGGGHIGGIGNSGGVILPRPPIIINLPFFCKNGMLSVNGECPDYFCGDGIVTPLLGEECDTGNEDVPLCIEGETDKQFCTSATDPRGACRFVMVPPCGPGLQESIDIAPFCGDGILQSDREEQCDDGGLCWGGRYHNAIIQDRDAAALCLLRGGKVYPQSGDGCNHQCRVEFCGDGTLQPGEDCDNGGVCKNAQYLSCSRDSDCDPGDTCIFNAKRNVVCTQNCALCQGLYTAAFDIRNLREGDHTLKIKVRTAGGASEVKETHFSISYSLLGQARASMAHSDAILEPHVLGENLEEAQPQILSVLTDKRHYNAGIDKVATVSVIVGTADGQYFTGLSNEAFAMAVDGKIISDISFTESKPDTCTLFLQEQENRKAPASFSQCGNGILEQGEQCDDGNTKSDDGCSAQCRIEGMSFRVHDGTGITASILPFTKTRAGTGSGWAALAAAIACTFGIFLIVSSVNRA
jgi:cysteine-rich repeat protein